MINNLNFRVTIKIIGLISSENNSEKTIVRNLFNLYQATSSTSHSNKDANITQRVLTSTIMSKQTKNYCLIRRTSKSLKISRTTLHHALGRREKIEDPNC